MNALRFRVQHVGVRRDKKEPARYFVLLEPYSVDRNAVGGAGLLCLESDDPSFQTNFPIDADVDVSLEIRARSSL